MWREVDSVIYYIPTNFKFHQSIAIFNLIGTLVKFKPNKQELKLVYWSKTVKDKLIEITEKGASIIVYESFYTTYVDHAKKLFELLLDDLKIPIVCFFSTSKNKYSKPFTNMWKLIELFYTKECKKINKITSIFVGNNAGRTKINNKSMKGCIIDRSCVDRSFAHNVGITFFTPDRFFLNSTQLSIWKFSDSIINKATRKVLIKNTEQIQVPVIIDEIYLLPKSDIYTVIITGSPSCGKTKLAKKIKKKWDIDYNIGTSTHISENDYDDFYTIQKFVNTSLEEKKSVIIDIKCIIENITKIVKTSMVNKVPILIIEIKYNREVAKLIDFIKIQTSKTPDLVLLSTIDWNNYYKLYKEPIYEEIPCVRYVQFPLIIELSEEYWYEYGH